MKLLDVNVITNFVSLYLQPSNTFGKQISCDCGWLHYTVVERRGLQLMRAWVNQPGQLILHPHILFRSINRLSSELESDVFYRVQLAPSGESYESNRSWSYVLACHAKDEINTARHSRPAEQVDRKPVEKFVVSNICRHQGCFFMCSASVVCFCMVQTPELNRALGPRNSGLLQYWSIFKLISPTVKFAIKLKLNSLPHFQCLWGAFKQLFRAYNAYNHCSAD